MWRIKSKEEFEGDGLMQDYDKYGKIRVPRGWVPDMEYLYDAPFPDDFIPPRANDIISVGAHLDNSGKIISVASSNMSSWAIQLQDITEETELEF